VRRVGAVYARELEALGFGTRWADLPSAMARAGHLVAVHRGSRGKRLLLIGHLDTVLEKEPFRREGDRALWQRRIGHEGRQSRDSRGAARAECVGSA
jgi:glutamate carboxypeptidase